jgi:hypothetical protein
MSVDEDTRAWLREHGATEIKHPGGTLYAHLCRVFDRLAGLGLEPDVALAGLAHAAYGTDGFAVALLPVAGRSELRELVGERVERLVYRYGACDRRRTWPYLARTGAVWDRFTDQVEVLPTGPLRDFVDLTIVNELDIVEQSPTIAHQHGDELRTLFAAWASAASPSVMVAVGRVFGP